MADGVGETGLLGPAHGWPQFARGTVLVSSDPETAFVVMEVPLSRSLQLITSPETAQIVRYMCSREACISADLSLVDPT